MKQTNTRFRHFEQGRTMEVLQDRAWKEENEEFGYQEIIPQDDSQVGLDYQTMEFEFDDIETTIRLRAKAEITGSTGLTLWTCAQILSGYLLENPHHVKNKRILELGAGLGLCSQIAYHLGAANVLATDGDLDVLRNLRFNMKQNQFSNNQTKQFLILSLDYEKTFEPSRQWWIRHHCPDQSKYTCVATEVH